MIEMMAICTFVVILGIAVLSACVCDTGKMIREGSQKVANQCLHIWSHISLMNEHQDDCAELAKRISDLEDKMKLLEDDGK